MAQINAINNNLGNHWFHATKTLTPSQVQGMFASPVLFDTIPQAGANQAIIIKNWGFDVSFNTTPYASGGSVELYYDTGRVGGASGTIAAANMNASSSVCVNGVGATTNILASRTINKPIYISNATGAFTSGDSNVRFYAIYGIVSFDASNPINCINNIPGENNYQIASLYIPAASVATLNSTPITIVNAPGSGLVLIPDRLTSLLIFNSVAYNSSTVQLIYGTSVTSPLSNPTSLISGTASQHASSAFSAGFNNFTPSNADNNALQIRASANPGSSGNSALKIYVSYSTITL